jgi:hypothetical protein
MAISDSLDVLLPLFEKNECLAGRRREDLREVGRCAAIVR